MTKSIISIIVAHDRNRGIGKNNKLILEIPNDLKRFKKLTTGHPVIMGRKTWESIPKKFRPLSNRTNIVITRNSDYDASGAIVVNSIEKALDIAKNSPGQEEIYIIGGGEIYKETLPIANRLYITILDKEVDADTFFPEYSKVFTQKVAEKIGGEHKGAKYSYLTLER